MLMRSLSVGLLLLSALSTAQVAGVPYMIDGQELGRFENGKVQGVVVQFEVPEIPKDYELVHAILMERVSCPEPQSRGWLLAHVSPGTVTADAESLRALWESMDFPDTMRTNGDPCELLFLNIDPLIRGMAEGGERRFVVFVRTTGGTSLPTPETPMRLRLVCQNPAGSHFEIIRIKPDTGQSPISPADSTKE